MGWWAVWLIAVCFTVSNVPDAKIKTDALFAYEFFSLLWVNAFVIAFGQMIIAGAVGVWYFTPNDAKGSLGTKPLRTGIKNAVIYHQGTLAFGSFVLAIVQFIKWWLRYLAKQAKLQHNKVMTVLFKILSYCVACFEKCIKFLNKNAYIQTALLGTKFCTSAKNAFFLILRNAARIGVLGAIGNAVRLFGYLFIMGKLGATAAAGYFITLEMYDGEINSPVVPIIIFVVVGYVVGKLITNVFGLAVDSMLQCFVADEELNKASGGAQCTPPLLKKFLDKNSKR
ncbi:ctl transporter, putative [Perkinsus marinus ATCC 50983]|uniref:Choline transporter-like protein n=1 Tax=Perkinsus marinus (strain ATCC 50983 / TXsc) TaxID=423536 RepID=C5L922_PERM5|nr:ctl transporter, putative [Perkinsus marinus ATCC 50983]EER06786.1 ctl transporter, putative [Perkinsus marinus ATCC 50983]|eukprot:XP_002774970.1 ctl transporter, putative [Perkinsus marinus ATCC 50983]